MEPSLKTDIRCLKKGKENMNLSEAWDIHNRFYKKDSPTEEDEFEFVEACSYIANNDLFDGNIAMYNLASYYLNKEEYELALKYFTLSEEKRSSSMSIITEDLAEIYYELGDYEKAYEYASMDKSAFSYCAIVMADLYKNGYYVDADPDKYHSIIEDMVNSRSKRRVLQEDITVRMAEIQIERGMTRAGVELLQEVRETGSKEYFRYPRGLRIYRRAILDLYSVIELDNRDMCLLDLYEVLRQPAEVKFVYNGTDYKVESVKEHDSVTVFFEGRWYRSADDFIKRAVLDGIPLYRIQNELTGFSKTG